MNELEEIQLRFQNSILQQDGSLLDDIVDTRKEKKSVLLGVYQHAYGARLIEFLENDFPVTASYLGEDMFHTIGRDYYLSHPSDNPNARWFGRHFPQFLKDYDQLINNPECFELALLEQGLATAFDAMDIVPLDMSSLAAIAPDEWAAMRFKAHPSVTRLTHNTNAQQLWTALNKDEVPPEISVQDSPVEILCWRGEGMARFRGMAYDEAMIFDAAMSGADFGGLCEMLGTYGDEDEAPMKAAGYLQAWLSSEVLIAAS